MITKFKHKGLKKLFETGNVAGIQPKHISRLQQILALLETASVKEDMNLPGLDLHELKGNRKETYSVKVSGNWRITFRINNGKINDVDYEDYH